MPDLAVTTDLIVGFPGETDADFDRTLEVVAEAGYDSAYTFIYSPRPGTEAAARTDRVRARRRGGRPVRAAAHGGRAFGARARTPSASAGSRRSSSRARARRTRRSDQGRTRQNKLVHFRPTGIVRSARAPSPTSASTAPAPTISPAALIEVTAGARPPHPHPGGHRLLALRLGGHRPAPPARSARPSCRARSSTGGQGKPGWLVVRSTSPWTKVQVSTATTNGIEPGAARSGGQSPLDQTRPGDERPLAEVVGVEVPAPVSFGRRRSARGWPHRSARTTPRSGPGCSRPIAEVGPPHARQGGEGVVAAVGAAPRPAPAEASSKSLLDHGQQQRLLVREVPVDRRGGDATAAATRAARSCSGAVRGQHLVGRPDQVARGAGRPRPGVAPPCPPDGFDRPGARCACCVRCHGRPLLNPARRALRLTPFSNTVNLGAPMFARLGTIVVRFRILVLAATAVFVIVAGGVGAAGVFGVLEGGGFDDPGSESTRGGRTARRALRVRPAEPRPHGHRRRRHRRRPGHGDRGHRLTERLAADPSVEQVVSYWSLGPAAAAAQRGRHPRPRVRPGRRRSRGRGRADPRDGRTDVGRRAGDTPITVEVGGAEAVFADITTQVEGDLARAESIAVPITLHPARARVRQPGGGLAAAGRRRHRRPRHLPVALRDRRRSPTCRSSRST